MQELAECLADPLVPKFSHRFFTGGAAAAVAAQNSTASAGESSAPEASIPHQAPIVQQAVNYANKMQAPRKAAAAEHGNKTQGEQKKTARPPSRPAKVSREMAEQQALQAALNRSAIKKDLRQRNTKLMVIPAAFGREKQGSDALQALRAKMGVSHVPKNNDQSHSQSI